MPASSGRNPAAAHGATHIIWAMMLTAAARETAWHGCWYACSHAWDCRWRRVIGLRRRSCCKWSQKNLSLALVSAEARNATRIAGVSRKVHRRAYRCAVYATVVCCDVARNPFNVGADRYRPAHISPPAAAGYYWPPRNYASPCNYRWRAECGSREAEEDWRRQRVGRPRLSCGRAMRSSMPDVSFG